MKQKNIISEVQKLENDLEFYKQKYSEVKEENLKLKKEVEDLKKNLANF